MIFNTRSSFMLKYEKAKSKLIEFDIEKNNYPKFPLNSDDLTYSTFYALSLYCEELIDNPDSLKLPELFENMTFISQYYDSTVKTKKRKKYSNLFLLLGATAYFLSENFGSAKVLIEQINEWNINNEIITLLYYTLIFLLKINWIEIPTNNHNIIDYIDACKNHFLYGEKHEKIFLELKKMRKTIYASSDIYGINYIDYLYAVVVCAVKHSTWVLLPKYSKWDIESWKEQLAQSENLKLLWPAQKVVVEAGVLTGKNLVVPLPTGVGKTKSIEIILRSKFMDKGTYIAVIIAPLRALCNEIINNLIPAFGDEAIINQFTDTVQKDFNLEILTNKKYVFVCTPEKFTYILRHETDFLSKINLFIFDEAHLFDDDTRGAQYELLMSEIRNNKDSSAQMILFSAVLSNANQISSWLFENEMSIIDHSLVKSTEKSIGFFSSDQTIHYYEKDNMDEESFYVPKSIDFTTLKYKSIFPKITVQDISIYYANKLCNQGAVAIYAGQVKSVPPIMRRITQIHKLGYDSSNLIKYGNNEEIQRISELISFHYGDDAELTTASKLGAFPHYANLPNGIKMSIEYALRKKNICFVICTTTLAEGVNIPLKYLFLTTFNYGNIKMQIRKIQNLVGRTARPGIHTEGSAIVTDPDFYDKRLTFEKGGKFRWAECKKMFDYGNTEACESAILSLVNDMCIDYECSYKGQSLSSYLINNYMNKLCFQNLNETIKEYYKKKVSEKRFNTYSFMIDLRINQIERVIESLENYLCYLYSFIQDKQFFNDAAIKLAQSTFAYYLANEEEKKALIAIFCLITKKIIEEVKLEKTFYFAKSLYGIETSLKVLSWVEQNIETINEYPIDKIIDEIIMLFVDLFNKLIGVSCTTLLSIVKMWINGKTYINIFNEVDEIKVIKLNQIEKLCGSIISYHLSFLIGNIIDAVSDDLEDLSRKLMLLQKQVKYGVPNQFQIFICENIFDDRFLAKQLDIAFEQVSVEENDFKEYIISRKQEILKVLTSYPEFFSYKFKLYIEG